MDVISFIGTYFLVAFVMYLVMAFHFYKWIERECAEPLYIFLPLFWPLSIPTALMIMFCVKLHKTVVGIRGTFEKINKIR